MSRKRNLLNELNITGHIDNCRSPLVIDIDKIKRMVNNNIDSSYSERKVIIMKVKKKIFPIALAAVLVLGITAFAAGGFIKSWYSSSSSKPDYKSLPTEQQCIKDIGYAPVLIETFENGYAFDSGSIVKNDLKDDSGNSVEKFKSVTFRYKNGGDYIYLSQEKFNSEIEPSGEVIANADGVDICYYSYMNKCVAGDYKLTEEDKEAEESGELVFSYGVEKDEIVEVKNVSWFKDGIHYSLMQTDGNLSPENMAEMAKEIISEK